jgi:hypothetical protein
MGQPLDFGMGRYLDSMKLGIVAAPPAAHAMVIKAVAKLRAEGVQAQKP